MPWPLSLMRTKIVLFFGWLEKRICPPGSVNLTALSRTELMTKEKSGSFWIIVASPTAFWTVRFFALISALWVMIALSIVDFKLKAEAFLLVPVLIWARSMNLSWRLLRRDRPSV